MTTKKVPLSSISQMLAAQPHDRTLRPFVSPRGARVYLCQACTSYLKSGSFALLDFYGDKFLETWTLTVGVCDFSPVENESSSGRTIYSIGHSTRPLDEFLDILKKHKIKYLADIRHFPGSKTNPQFNPGVLILGLPKIGATYEPIQDLGGHRTSKADSLNGGWKGSFRHYADYMQTREFGYGIEKLTDLASMHPTAMMCAESVPWRCHRSLVSDYLIAHDWDVVDLGCGEPKRRRLTPFARPRGDMVIYPPTAAE